MYRDHVINLFVEKVTEGCGFIRESRENEAFW